ncbi:MAG: hypothetical protein AVDCRST_MAG28-3641, partial [uncultured Rubrobacteraceae bacterium]
LGCGLGQYHHISKPLLANELGSLLAGPTAST